MKEFWIVCKWDNYYPSGGIDDISLITFNWQEAKDMYEAWFISPKQDYRDAVTNLWVDSRTDNCKIYSSSQLPWGDNK